MEDTTLQMNSVVSFRAYEARQKSRLKAMYPFLSADQIHGKLTKQWKQLEESERKQFTKKCFKVTPTKESRNKTPKRKYVRDKTPKRTAGNQQSKVVKYKHTKNELQVCDTPEYVNTEKLNDFRKQHSETYDNDFFEENPTTGSLQHITDIFGSSDEHEGKDRNSSFSSTPEAPGNTKLKQGILKSRFTSRHLSAKQWGPRKSDQASAHVSFNSPPEHDIDKDNSYCFQSDHSDDYSDADDDAVLLRRGDFDTNAAVEAFNDSSDDDSAVLIRREAEDYTDLADENADKFQDEKNNIAEKQTGEGAGKKRKKSSEIRETKRAKKNKLNEDLNNNNIETNVAADVNDDSINNDSQENILFRSPLQKKTRRLRKSKTELNSKQSAVSRTPVLGTTTAQVCAQVTPAALGNTKENNVTPHMDELLQKIAFDEAGRAPHKKHAEDVVPEAEKMKAMAVGRRVTRSLMSSKGAAGKENMQGKANTSAADKQQKPGKLVAGRRTPGRRGKKGNKDNKAIDSDDSTGTTMNAFGDAGQNSTVDTPDLAENSVPGDLIEKKSNVHSKGMKADIEDTETDTDDDKMDGSETGRCDEGVMFADHKIPCLLPLDSESWCSSQESSGSQSDITKRARPKVNPALLRALRSLQMSKSPDVVPAWASTTSSSEQSHQSSPGLLSPALSGVSELTSESSVDDSGKVAKDSSMTAKVPEPLEEGLCDMFGEVTPPDMKTKGLYKTQRTLASGGSDNGNKNFKQLFQNDDDFLFF